MWYSAGHIIPLLASSKALRGPLWGPLASLSSLYPTHRTLLNKALNLSWLSFLAQQGPESAPSATWGSIYHPVSEIVRMSNRLLPLPKNLVSRTP